MGQADDGVQRGADLVAHVGQELTLGLGGGFGQLLGAGEFGGARAHPLLELRVLLQDGALLALALGDVRLHRDEAFDAPAGVEHRGDLQRDPVRTAAPGAIQQLLAHRTAFAQRLRDARHGLRVGLRALQQRARLAAGDVGQRVPGELGEGAVDPLGAALCIGDDDHVVGRARDDGQARQLVLRELLPCHVADHADGTAFLGLRRRHLDPGEAAIRAPSAQRHRLGACSLGRLAPWLAPGLAILLDQQLGQRATQAFLRLAAEDAARGRVHEHDAAVRAALEHRLRQHLDPPPHPLLGSDERLGQAVGRLDVQVGGGHGPATVCARRHRPALLRHSRPAALPGSACWRPRARTAGRWSGRRSPVPAACAPRCSPTGS